MHRKKILLVDDHEIVRDAFRFYFENDEDFIIKGEASNGKEALSVIRNDSNYDVIITDINMPEMNGLELVGEIQKLNLDLKILVLSMFDDISSIKKMLALDINGYILKDTGKKEVVRALKCILEGENYFSSEVSQRVMGSFVPSKAPKARLVLETELSSREKEILRLILLEKTNQEIADELFISVRTVEGHKSNMLMKTGCKNLVGLTLYAVEHKLLDPA